MITNILYLNMFSIEKVKKVPTLGNKFKKRLQEKLGFKSAGIVIAHIDYDVNKCNQIEYLCGLKVTDTNKELEYIFGGTPCVKDESNNINESSFNTAKRELLEETTLKYKDSIKNCIQVIQNNYVVYIVIINTSTKHFINSKLKNAENTEFKRLCFAKISPEGKCLEKQFDNINFRFHNTSMFSSINDAINIHAEKNNHNNIHNNVKDLIRNIKPSDNYSNQESVIVIGLAGYKGSGKDTAAEVLIKKHNYTRIAFADVLRKACLIMFPSLSLEMFTDVKLKDKLFDNPIKATVYNITLALVDLHRYCDIPYKAFIEIKENLKSARFVSPRDILQKLGTDNLRKLIGPDYIINVVRNQIDEIKGNIIFTDVRFENERHFIRYFGKYKNVISYIILIQRIPTIDNDNIPPHESEMCLGPIECYDHIYINNTEISDMHNYMENTDTMLKLQLQLKSTQQY